MTRETRTGRNEVDGGRTRALRRDLRNERLRRWGAHLGWRAFSIALSLWLLWGLMAWVESQDRGHPARGVASGPPPARALVLGLAPARPGPAERAPDGAGR